MITIRACAAEPDYAVAADLIAELGAWDSAETQKLGFLAQDVLDFYYSTESGSPGAIPAGPTLLGSTQAGIGGCVAYRHVEAGVCELKRLYVRPGFRRFGLGRALVSCLIADARAAHYTRMRLETVSFMRDAIRMYEGMGFGRRGPYYDIPGVFLPITIFMEKDLAEQEESPVQAMQAG